MAPEGDIYQAGTLSGKPLTMAAGIPSIINRIGSMGTLFFTSNPVTDFETAKISDQDLFRKYYKETLEAGIYLAPSPFEAGFVSTAHGQDMIRKTIECARKAFQNI